MKRWWVLGLAAIILCLVSSYFCLRTDCFLNVNPGYISLPNAHDVLAQKQIKPTLLTKIWIDTVEPARLCFSIKQEITSAYVVTLKFYIDGYRSFYRWVENFRFPTGPFMFCTGIQNIGIGQHVARVEFKSPAGQEYSYTWVFEVKEDGFVPEVTANGV